MQTECAWCRRPNLNPDRSICNSCYPSEIHESIDNQEIERAELESRIPSHAMQEALTCANLILGKWDEWEAEAAQQAQIEQDYDAYLGVMREYIAEVIHAAIERAKK